MKNCHDCVHSKHGDWGDVDGPRYGCAHEKRRDVADWLRGFWNFDDGLPTEAHCDGKPCPMWAEAPKPKPEPLGVLITREDLSKMLLHEVRYSLGRMTGAPDECAQRVRLYWPRVSPQMRECLTAMERASHLVCTGSHVEAVVVLQEQIGRVRDLLSE